MPFDCLHTKSKEGDTNTMETENGAVILLIVLTVSAFLLLAIKFAEFIARFNRETKYIIMEINRACRSRNCLYADSKCLCDKAESHRNGRRNGLLQYKGR